MISVGVTEPGVLGGAGLLREIPEMSCVMMSLCAKISYVSCLVEDHLRCFFSLLLFGIIARDTGLLDA